MDLFENEQDLYDKAISHLANVREGLCDFNSDEFAAVTRGYGRLLKQLRRLTKTADETTGTLHNRALDLSDKDLAKSRFLARMSHEIRTPISAVLGISEIELQNPNISPKTEEAFAKIYNSANILLGLVNDILDLSKIEAGKMVIVNDTYNVAELINDVVQVNMVYITDKKIDFLVKADENIPARLSGDELRIRQILTNLLSNAFKYTSEGTVELSVHTEKASYQDQVLLVLTISDTGHGMSEEQLESLKEEYSRFHEKEHRATTGTGLGMPITFSLVQLMEASLDIDSKVGKGTTMLIKIPQDIIGKEIIGSETAKNIGKLESGTRTKKLKFQREAMPYGKVLVVDDVDTNLYVARGLLDLYHLDIDTCSGGHETIDRIKGGETYDIIFMDHMMPELDGMETTNILRRIGYDLPIVALTANALAGQSEEFMNNGFDGYLSKPIHTMHLDSLLNKFIRDKQPPEVIESARRMAENGLFDEDEEDVENDNSIDDDLPDDDEDETFFATPEMAAMIRKDFLSSQQTVHEDIIKAIEQGDLKAAHILAHTLKGYAGLLNEQSLKEAAEAVEISLKSAHIPSNIALHTLKDELNQIFSQLKIPV